MIKMHPSDDDGESLKRRGMTAASDIDRLSQEWEVQIKSCPFVRSALDTNLAGMLLNNSIRDRQTEAGASLLAFLRRSFGRKERIVNALDMLLRDTFTRVGH